MNYKNELFVSEYIQSGNATESAIKAGYSNKTAYSIGQRLLKNVEIMEQIEKYKNEVSKVAIITVAEIIKELVTITKGNPNEYVKLKAFDMMLKHLGGYKNDLNVVHAEQPLFNDITDFSDKELMDEIERRKILVVTGMTIKE